MLNWISSALSTEQQQPFLRTSSNACILAAAGSGKTKTLTHLVAADLAAGIPAANIIAFTFTEKAAEELLARIHLIVKTNIPNVDLTGMYIGTIHGWCLQYLKEQSDFYNVDPIDELHLDALVSRLYDPLELANSYGKPYPKAISDFLADVEIFHNEQLELDSVPELIRRSIGLFLDFLKTNRLMTFGTMIRDAVLHLRQHGPVETLQALYVDEYQDVNPAQVALIKAMLPLDGKLIAVGDDLQCIYQWRGSDVKRILGFEDEFAPAATFRLTTNYRARPSIVSFGNRIAERVLLRDPEKVMNPGRQVISAPAIHWFSCVVEEDQALHIVRIVHEFHSSGVPWNKMAVLMRSVISSGKPIIEAFESHDVPYDCPLLSRGGAFINNFILPVFDWLRTEHPAPKNSREEAEIEAATNKLWEQAHSWLPSDSRTEDRFWDALNTWLKLIDEGRAKAYDVRGRLYDFFNECGVHINPEDHNLTVSLGIATQIIRSVEEIHRRRIAGQTRRTPRGIMSEIYFALIRNQADFGESLPVSTTTERVLITTVHQSKGLEWPVVILPRLDNRRFPVPRRPHGTSFPDSTAQRYGTGTDDERRLFYVAATRARERLFLLDCANGKDLARSLFLRELESDGTIAPIPISNVTQEVWRIAAEDLVDAGDSPLRIGLSDVLLYLECPYQYGLRRVAGVQPSVGDELGFGRGLHEMIQRRFDADQSWTPSELNEQAQRHVHVPLMSEEQEKRAREAIKERIKSLEALGVFSAQVEPEVDVEVIFPEGIIHGIVDGIQSNADGTMRVRDWKSSIHEELVPRYEKQLQFYAYAIRQRGGSVTGADLVDVVASAKEETLVTQEVDVEDRTVAGIVSEIRNALRGINDGAFSPTPNKVACGSCDMYRVCAVRYIE